MADRMAHRCRLSGATRITGAVLIAAGAAALLAAFAQFAIQGQGTPAPPAPTGQLAGIRYDPGDPRRSDLDLWRREITVRGKGGKTRTVKIGYGAVRALDRYIRVRARHAQACRPQLWLG